MRAGVLAAAERRPRVGQAFCPRRVTRLIGVPRLFAVVAEEHAAAGTLARQLGTACTARRYHHVPAAAASRCITSLRNNSRQPR